ncbi:MAG: hypothetical protein AAFR59_06205, partial [Bacteroidota bacterium]
MNLTSILTRPLISWGILMGVYVIHAVGFWDWIVDDGGISLTYARSLAEGVGLVPQAGRPPTEAYSNPLWIGLCAVGMWLGVEDLYFLVSGWNLIFLGITAYVWISAGKRWLKWSPIWSFIFLMSLCSASPLIRWMNSGLENGLYLLLLSLYVIEMYKGEEDKWSGVYLGLLALVRPEGILFGVLYLGYFGQRKPGEAMLDIG